MKCPNCDGKGFNTIRENGKFYIEDCEICNGTGELRKNKTNRDRFMEMSNKELAERINAPCVSCIFNGKCGAGDNCREGIERWLANCVED